MEWLPLGNPRKERKMAFEQKDMTGSLFVNGRKEKDTHADYNGSVKIDGRDAWISGWQKQDKNGNTYLSLSLKWKDGTSDRPAQEFVKATKAAFPESQVTKGFDPDQEVPF